MGFINRQNRTMFTIANGKLNNKRDNQIVASYDTIYGTFIGLGVRERNVAGEMKKFCNFEFQDGNELFTISSELYKANTNTILSRLVNIPDYNAGHVYISTWQETKGNITYTNVSVQFKRPGDARPQRIERVEIPKVQDIRVPETGEMIKSTKAMRDAVDDLVKKIQDRFAQSPSYVNAAEDDLPEGDADPQPGFMPEPHQAPRQPQYIGPQQPTYQGPQYPGRQPQYPGPQGGYQAPQYPGRQGQQAPDYGVQPGGQYGFENDGRF